MGAFSREQAHLAAAGLPSGIAAAGSTLPDAELLDTDGSTTTLYAATGDRPAVVVFYRGAWCPYCNITLATYQGQLVPALTDRNIGLIAISPQNPDGSLSMQQKHDLTFTVLSDPGSTLARHLGILTGPSADARAAQLQLGMDLTAINADGTTTLPMPTTLSMDAAHVINWIDVHPDYTTRSEPAEILAAVEQAGY
jgi:peroxiredoxin